jgi:hypothetical protein
VCMGGGVFSKVLDCEAEMGISASAWLGLGPAHAWLLIDWPDDEMLG